MAQQKGTRKKKASGVKIALAVFAALIAALLSAYAVMMYLIPALETVDERRVEGSENWMARLDGDKSISEVILPGTHDAGTSDAGMAFFSRCQALTVKEQLEAGFRYLDIRAAEDGEGLKLMHGFVNCTENAFPWSKPLSMESVLDDCYSFLRAHTSEFIVFAVKQERNSDDTANIEAKLNALIKKNEDLWLLTDRLPTVREARGKLVLLRRYGDAAALGARSGIGLSWLDQSDRNDTAQHTVNHLCGGVSLWVQDRYKYTTEEKWAAFTEGLKTAKTGRDEAAIHFLSTNGKVLFGHPYAHAKALNARLLEERPALNGWVVVDFGTPSVAESIYSANF
ncbi:MAG: hypothetical protein IJU52_04660 [Clostridia bacterium]|nr:hypothetical protein [Clostridia bacterium]